MRGTLAENDAVEIIRTIEEMHRRSDGFRAGGHTIGLVPTMGYFHEGHLELMRVAKRHADRVIVSLFVNPLQFGVGEDFGRYPRDTEGDLAKARNVGVDVVYMPSADQMYPAGFQTEVRLKDLPQHLCGLSRPGHFEGVATVVAKLFNATKPHIAVFGQKDYQQLAVITRMVMDLDMDIEIVGVPTVREHDGLAMSSRNTYLSPAERVAALCLKKSLDLAEEMFHEGRKDPGDIREAMTKLIDGHPFTRIDYITLCDPVTLEDLQVLQREVLVALAVRVGSTRLIDNRVLRETEDG